MAPSMSPAHALPQAEDLCVFLDAAPSPFHAVAESARRLRALGFGPLDATAAWPAEPGRHFCVQGGSIVAWATDGPRQAAQGFRIVGAHTDSPNLRIKPRPDTGRVGWRQLGVEVYGGGAAQLVARPGPRALGTGDGP